MTAKKTRNTREAGDPLPTTLPSDRVLRALEVWSIKEKDFIVAYDEARGTRGLSTTPLTAGQKAAIKSFLTGKLGQKDAMEKAEVKTAGAFLNMVEKYHAE